MSVWRLLVTDMMKSCSVAILIRPPSLANTEDRTSEVLFYVCVHAFAHTSYEYRFVCAQPWRSKSVLHGRGDTESKAMTLVNSKHTTESSLEELSSLLAALLH